VESEKRMGEDILIKGMKEEHKKYIHMKRKNLRI
jgi:hypothetical protein